jgi:hypothetical protein
VGDVLATKSKDWYEFASLLLMLCLASIPDGRLVPVMHGLFTHNEVTPKFVLRINDSNPIFCETTLHYLGRQVSNAKNVILSAATTMSLGRVPRDYTQIVLNYKGCGPKMALVTIHTSYNDVVGDQLIIIICLSFICYRLCKQSQFQRTAVTVIK